MTQPSRRGALHRVVIADDHPAFRAGIQALLAGERDITVTGMVANSTELVSLLGRESCDLVLTDFSMPGGRYGDGLSLVAFIRRRFPQARLLVLTGLTNGHIMHNLRSLNVNGILSKTDGLHHVIQAIREVLDGHIYLSPAIEHLLLSVGSDDLNIEIRLTRRESEVLRLFAQGLSIIQIATMLARSSKTISTQKMAAMRKLGLRNDAELFDYAATQGMITASQTSAKDEDGSHGGSNH